MHSFLDHSITSQVYECCLSFLSLPSTNSNSRQCQKKKKSTNSKTWNEKISVRIYDLITWNGSICCCRFLMHELNWLTTWQNLSPNTLDFNMSTSEQNTTHKHTWRHDIKLCPSNICTYAHEWLFIYNIFHLQINSIKYN